MKLTLLVERSAVASQGNQALRIDKSVHSLRSSFCCWCCGGRGGNGTCGEDEEVRA